MEEYIKAFLGERRASGCTKSTMTWHTSCLKKFRTWAESEGITDIEKVTPLDLRRYVVYLQESNLSQTSVATYVRSLRAFMRWLHDEELIEKNVIAKVKEPKTPDKQKQPFSDADVKALLAVATPRERAMLALLFDCGLRANEMCLLTRDDIRLDERVVVVFGKGQKQRTVPISVASSLILRKYLLKHKDTVVFPSRKGGPLTPNGLLAWMRRLAKRAGVTDAYPHRCRHTFAISYLRNGGNPLTLQRILGHANIETTLVYTKFDLDDLKGAHELASPLTAWTK